MTCFLFHRWGEWKEKDSFEIVLDGIKTILWTMRQRECNRCHVVAEEKVYKILK